VLLDDAARLEIEKLVGAADLDIRLDSDRVIALHERIEEFAQRDLYAFFKSLGKIAARRHLLDREAFCQFRDLLEAELVEPFRIVMDLGRAEIDDLACLVEIAFEIILDIFPCKHRALVYLIRRIAYLSREITDDKDHSMPEVLKISQFSQRNGATKMDLRARRVDAELDAQLLPRKKLFLERFAHEHLFHSARHEIFHGSTLGNHLFGAE